MPRTVYTPKARQHIDNLFSSYSIPHKLDASTKTVDRIKYVRGIYNIMLSEDMNCPQNLTDEDAFEFSFRSKHTIYRMIKELRADEMEREVKKEIEKQKEAKTQEMLKKYGSFENFPLPNYYFERSTHDRLQQGFCEKILRMNAEEQPNIVIDCGYQKQDSVMKRALHSQLTFVNSFVRSSETLLKISITSCDSVYKVPEQIEALNGSNLYTVTSDDFLSLPDNKEIIYLSPHTKRPLTHVSPNCTYVIGGLVDLHQNLPYSITRARKMDVKTACLPLDKFFHWDKGTKCLTIDQMVKILYTLWETQNWYEALSFVPKRKASPRPELIAMKPVNMKHRFLGAFQNYFTEMDIMQEFAADQNERIARKSAKPHFYKPNLKYHQPFKALSG